MAASDPMVQIRGLRFFRASRVILDGIDLDIPRDRVTVIMGPNGVGKTTLLRLIGGQLRPAAGRVIVDGEDVHRLGHNGLYRLRRRLGMLFQGGALFTDLDVFENVAFPLREHTRLSDEMIRDLVLMKLETVGLRGARRLNPGQLSGGMARRVALARAIALDPVMIMYDEPFAGLDPISTAAVVKLLRVLNDVYGLTSIIVSHDVHETLDIADQVFLLSGGKVVAQGSPDAVRRSDSAWVKQFVQGLPDGPVPFHYPAPDYAEDLLGEEAVA